jgi:WhiB family redox-sensing transcriptional regulator
MTANVDSLAWLDYDQLEALMDTGPGVRSIPWQTEAECDGKDVDMFPENSGAILLVKRDLCGPCPVRYECLAYVLSTSTKSNDFGVWGHTSVRERRRIRSMLAARRRQRARGAA